MQWKQDGESYIHHNAFLKFSAFGSKYKLFGDYDVTFGDILRGERAI